MGLRPETILGRSDVIVLNRHFGKPLRLVALVSLFQLLTAASAHPAGSDRDAGNWRSYFGNDKGWSYSDLDGIDRTNVGRLLPAWAFSTGESGLSATPLVIDGVLLLPTPRNQVFALDAATGRRLWTYSGKLPERVGVRTPLALASGFGLVFLGSTDHHLIAIDEKTGHEVWNVQLEDPKQCGCSSSAAPLIVKDKVVIGVSGEVAHRGYLDAFDAKTGKRAWRFWTIPGPGEPGHETWPGELWKFGSTSTWYVGSYDSELNLIYWGMANPGPMLGGDYPGAKLYSESLVALDADTGKLKWYFQELPNDKLDFDSVLEPVLIDAEEGGKLRRLVVHPTKSGFTYVIDRVTGKFIRAYPFADAINWTKGIDKNGRPLEPRLTLELGVETLVCPGALGARAAGHSTFSPHTHLWYNTSYEICTGETAIQGKAPQEGQGFNAASFTASSIPPDTRPFIAAFDPVTGARKWTSPTNAPNVSSLMSTAGDVIFGGDIFGNAWALDATSGEKLWSFNIGTGISSMPVTYAVGNRQFVAISGGLSVVGSTLAKAILKPEELAKLPPTGAVLFVFALPETDPGAKP
jgi:alcohol dehydrogenase (cytochrome c)